MVGGFLRGGDPGGKKCGYYWNYGRAWLDCCEVGIIDGEVVRGRGRDCADRLVGGLGGERRSGSLWGKKMVMVKRLMFGGRSWVLWAV